MLFPIALPPTSLLQQRPAVADAPLALAADVEDRASDLLMFLILVLDVDQDPIVDLIPLNVPPLQ